MSIAESLFCSGQELLLYRDCLLLGSQKLDTYRVRRWTDSKMKVLLISGASVVLDLYLL